MATLQNHADRARRSDGRRESSQGARARVSVDGKSFVRGGEKLLIRGVTYGPFAPDGDGQTFLSPGRVGEDFERMQEAGINSVRTYHVPPDWFLDLADERGMTIYAGLPWLDVPHRRHFAFLESRRVQEEARRFVRQAAERGRGRPCLLGYGIGNEIPPDIVRWHGAGRVERSLAELADVVRQADPDGLVTYASYPPTEFLDPSAFDFVTFNVYLHDREAFRRYLFRLQNLVGDRPLLLGELGMDTLRNGELEQAHLLAGHLEEARLMGLAGAFVFAWTDDWHTGGHQIEDWAFGITDKDRHPKPSYHALRELFLRPVVELLPETPRVSMVVCSYNGGRTLEQCLQSLIAVEYPDYEVILVDDGSTDDTPAISARFPEVRVIRQENRGLSVARNVGLHAATGAIVAYTDSDCFADRNWLTHLVYQFQRSGAAAVGGPNLTPEDGWAAACVAASPGQPTHVLESDQVAEHIPGCNMAFRREALLAIKGFDPLYRKAGDDVDVCWRLQHAGMWISFAPGAFIWHHRRQGVRAYLKQQAGYGEAEAILRFEHPDRFNVRGESKWRGSMYGSSSLGLRLSQPIIYRGTFSAGFFQCLYTSSPAHWAMLPSTLEWHLVAALVALMAALFWPPAWMAGAAMLGLSLVVAALQAMQARLPAPHDAFISRLLVAALCYAQPLVRSWSRYRLHLFSPRGPSVDPTIRAGRREVLPLSGALTVGYWSEDAIERTELLGLVIAYLNEHRWGKVIDSGWSDWDLELSCDRWTAIRVCTAQEDYGANKRLIRARFRLRPSAGLKAIAATAALTATISIGAGPWPAVGAALLAALCLGLWWRGTRRAAKVVDVFDIEASRIGLVRCHPSTEVPGEDVSRESPSGPDPLGSMTRPDPRPPGQAPFQGEGSVRRALLDAISRGSVRSSGAGFQRSEAENPLH